MTKQILTSYGAFIFMGILMFGAYTTHASEVTGTLSSDASSNSQTSGKDLGGSVSSNQVTTGDIEGTVSSDTETSGNIEGSVSSDSSGGGSSSSGGSRGSSSDRPDGSVLGEFIDNTSAAPGFPNAGFATNETKVNMTIWSTIFTFIRNIAPF